MSNLETTNADLQKEIEIKERQLAYREEVIQIYEKDILKYRETIKDLQEQLDKTLESKIGGEDE